MRSNVAKRWGWLVPAALAVIVYLPAFEGGLVWDDDVVINSQIHVFKNAKDVFFPPDHIPQWAQNYYRPVIVLTYLLDNRLYGAGATLGPHLSNVVFHVLVTLFVWLFSRQCLRSLPQSEWGAVVAACLFAVHPIHTESVSWVTGRSDAVAALFAVPSVVAALHYRDSHAAWALIAAPVLFLLGLLSKEVALSVLMVLPVLFFLVPARHNGKRPATGSTIALAVLYLAALGAYFFLRSQGGVGYGTGLGVGLGELLLRFWRATAYYLLKTIVPAPQLNFVSLSDLPGAGWSTVIIAGISTAMVLASRLWREAVSLILVAVAWFACTLSPSLVIALKRISENPVAERYLYLPSVSLCLFAGGAVCVGLARHRRRSVAAVAILAIGLYGAGTVARGMVWMDNIELWTDTTGKAPNQGLPWMELGEAYRKAGNPDQALACYQRAIASDYDDEGRAIGHSNIGMLHGMRGEFDLAESHFKAAIEIRKDYSAPYFGLGSVALQRLQKAASFPEKEDLARRAEGHFLRAVGLNPHYTKARWGLIQSRSALGGLAEQKGDREGAASAYRQAIEDFEELKKVDSRFALSGPGPAQAIDRIRARLEALKSAGP